MPRELTPNVLLVLVFPDSSTLRWAYEPPRVGSAMVSDLGRSWRVKEVLQSGVGSYTVHCGPQEGRLAATQELAADLLERARKAISPLERRRRNYLP